MAGPTTVYCALCLSSFPSRAAYNQHMAQHDEPTAEKLPCPACPFIFDDSYALEQHMRLSGHTDELGYTCPICHDKFASASRLKEHRVFPSPCNQDVAMRGGVYGTKPFHKPRATSQAPSVGRGRGRGYVDLDAPAPAPVLGLLPHNGSQPPTARCSTPSNVDPAEYCNRCNTTFYSQATKARHFLMCFSRNSEASPVDADERAQVAPARSLLETASPITPNAVATAAAPAEQLHITAPTPAEPPQATLADAPQVIPGASSEAASVAAPQPARVAPSQAGPAAPSQPATTTPHQPVPIAHAQHLSLASSRFAPAASSGPAPVASAQPTSTAPTQNASLSSSHLASAATPRNGTLEASRYAPATSSRPEPQPDPASQKHEKASHNTVLCLKNGCGKSFPSVEALSKHMENKHGGVLLCGMSRCGKTFSSSDALNQHRSASRGSSSPVLCGMGGCDKHFRLEEVLNQHRSDSHGRQTFNIPCGIDGCVKCFSSTETLGQHKKESHSGISCDIAGCKKSFASPKALGQHKRASHGATALCEVGGCGKTFTSAEALNQHKKDSHTGGVCGIDGCRKPFPSAEKLSQHKRESHNRGGQAGGSQLSSTSVCNIGGCKVSFRSEAGLKQHNIDNHNVGSKASHHAPETRRHAGGNGPSALAAQHPAPPSAQNGRGASSRAWTMPPQAPRAPATRTGPIKAPPVRAAPPTVRVPRLPTPPPISAANAGPDPGLFADIEQANQLQDKIMRLLITADISIQYDGSILYEGVPWTRISVVKQSAVVEMLDPLVHYDREMQVTFQVSSPKTFAEDFDGYYPFGEYEHLEGPGGDRSALSVVALSCCKVLLRNSNEEVVKVGAVDVLTGRPLLNYLVCDDPTEQVQNWRTSVTGLASFSDFETARTQKFKILKGWKAVRAALNKFADGNTIILGHNLHSDLEALRITHGRSIDVVKRMEGAAGGSLSKQQVRLDTLVRDLIKTNLKVHHIFGRDSLQDAFAIRELALWTLKHNDEFIKYAKNKSREYQMVSGM